VTCVRRRHGERYTSSTSFRRPFFARRGRGAAAHFLLRNPEDILLAKLAWYRAGGENCERQWSDLAGIWRMQEVTVDRVSLEGWDARISTDIDRWVAETGPASSARAGPQPDSEQSVEQAIQAARRKSGADVRYVPR
jgi:hypothetical protein